jgi:hypothetical protein
VDFLNLQDSTDPPDWRMKIFTQAFDDSTQTMTSQVLKISRDINEIADNLARLAFYSPAVQSDQSVPSCSYEHYALQFPLLAALNTVSLDLSRILAASCC